MYRQHDKDFIFKHTIITPKSKIFQQIFAFTRARQGLVELKFRFRLVLYGFTFLVYTQDIS